MKSRIASKRALVALGCAVLLGLCACGIAESDGASESKIHAMGKQPSSLEDGTDQRGPVKLIQWGPTAVARQSIELGALVPYCEYAKPRPYVERVRRRRTRRGLVLTMVVRFPSRPVGSGAGGCLWVEVGVSKWVRLGRDAKELKIFDGSPSPPTRRLFAD